MKILLAIASILSVAQGGIIAAPLSLSVVNSHRNGDSFSYSTYPNYHIYQQQLQHPQYLHQHPPVLTSIYQGGAIYHTIPGIQFAAPGAATVAVIGAAGYPLGINPIYGNPAIVAGPIFGQPVNPVQQPTQGPPQVPIGVPVDQQPVVPPATPPGAPIGPPPIIPDGPVTDDNDTVAIESS